MELEKSCPHPCGGWAPGILSDSPYRYTFKLKQESPLLVRKFYRMGLEPASGYTLYYGKLDLTSLLGFSGDLQYFLGFRRWDIRCNEGERGKEMGRDECVCWVERVIPQVHTCVRECTVGQVTGKSTYQGMATTCGTEKNRIFNDTVT